MKIFLAGAACVLGRGVALKLIPAGDDIVG